MCHVLVVRDLTNQLESFGLEHGGPPIHSSASRSLTSLTVNSFLTVDSLFSGTSTVKQSNAKFITEKKFCNDCSNLKSFAWLPQEDSGKTGFGVRNPGLSNGSDSQPCGAPWGTVGHATFPLSCLSLVLCGLRSDGEAPLLGPTTTQNKL